MDPLAARVTPLPALTDGMRAELVVDVPPTTDRLAEAVQLVAGHVEPAFNDPPAVRFNLRVALNEALANAIQYGSRRDPGRPVRVRVRFGPARIEVEIADDGDGFDPAAVPDPTTPEGIRRPAGRGLFLIQHLMDEVRFNARGNVIWMTLRRG